MKKCLIIFKIVLIFIAAITLFQSTTLATGYDFNSALTEADKLTGNETIETKTRGIASIIIKLIQITGTGIAVLMLTYMGIKYMMMAPNEKADFKKSMTGFVVGAVILFAASNIVAIIANFATSNI